METSKTPSAPLPRLGSRVRIPSSALKRLFGSERGAGTGEFVRAVLVLWAGGAGIVLCCWTDLFGGMQHLWSHRSAKAQVTAAGRLQRCSGDPKRSYLAQSRPGTWARLSRRRGLSRAQAAARSFRAPVLGRGGRATDLGSIPNGSLPDWPLPAQTRSTTSPALRAASDSSVS